MHVYRPSQWLLIPPSRLLNTLLDLQICWLGYAQTACWTAGHIDFMSQSNHGFVLELSSVSLSLFCVAHADSLPTHFAISVQVQALRVRCLQYERSQA